MRRLAKQTRDDEYASRRDYQAVTAAAGRRLRTEGGVRELRWTVDLEPSNEPRLLGAGGFIRTPSPAVARLRVDVDGEVLAEATSTLGDSWMRLGRAVEVAGGRQMTTSIWFTQRQDYVDVWGLAAGVVAFPKRAEGEHPPIAELNVSHLMPESLHLNHSDALPVGLSGFSETSDGGAIELKKCSYCGRHLPVGPGAAGGQSFHKHNAKLSGHQNECRSCKKWKINDHFNPRRTGDQHNEYGIISRERRILAREAEIMQRVKEREGRGLKSIIWERFDRSCFYCGKKISLDEMQLDHTRPLAYLWPIDEHATSLCSEHNNHKKDRFPVDFYNQEQLKRLAEITGLSLNDLSAKSVCEPELDRIRSDIAEFARSVDPRTFNAVARKVAELRPDIDLWAELWKADRRIHFQARRGANARPEAVAAE